MEKMSASQKEHKAYNDAADKLRDKFTLNGIEYTAKNGRYYSNNGYGAKRISQVEYDAAFQNRVFTEVNNGE